MSILKIKNVTKALCITILLFINYFTISSQTKIFGKVIDQKTGEALIGATVIIESVKRGAATDFEGAYSINNLPTGTYSVLCKLISYKDKVIENVVLKSGEPMEVNFTMEEPTGTNLNEIVIVGDLNRENLNTIFIEQKNRASVSDGISAETIKRTPDRNTSDVLKRVSGATIQENKFAIIRGLNDRYNAAYLNGAPLPSSESDRKAFSFDIFPSNLLDNLIIIKTATPDLPADFAGGIIQINTKNVPDKNYQSITIGAGYNDLATFKERISYNGGKTDWIGIDDGTRALPKDLPSRDVITSSTPQQNAENAKLFAYDWRTNVSQFTPNIALQYTGAYSTKINEKTIGAIYALTYNKSNSYFEAVRNDFLNASSDSVDAEQEFELKDKNYVTNVLGGALVNLTFKPNNRNQFTFKNIYNINTENRFVEREGEREKYSVIPDVEKSTVMWFTENRLYSGQLGGDHEIKPNLIKFKWSGNYSKINRDIPNLRRFVQQKKKFKFDPNDVDEPEPVFEAAIQPDNTTTSAAGNFFFSENIENTYGGQTEITYDLHKDSTALKNDIKLGAGFQLRSRDFVSRNLGFSRYGIAGGTINFDKSLLLLSQDSIFLPENLGLLANGKGGFKLSEATKPSDSYSAESSLYNVYLMDDMRATEKLRFIFGARLESFDQKLNSFAEDGTPINLKFNKVSILPSVNAVYAITSKSNIRAGYAQTLSRPEYRELAPFGFFDFTTNFSLRGNDKLRPGSIQNYDLRFEYFPGKAQIFSVSLFRKTFVDAIEQISSDVDARTITFQNASSAKNTGVEAEIRVLFATIFQNDSMPFFKDLTFFSNASYIISKVTVDKNAIGALSVERTLQGQSPYIINAGLQYQNNDLGIGGSISYNKIGRRIFIVGNTLEPSIYEQGRDLVDLQINKTLFKNKMEIKLNVRDLLAQKLYFYQDENKNGKLDIDSEGLPLGKGTRRDNIMFSNNNARTVSLSLSYKF
jgi:TonB-dependent receptor